MMNAKEMLKIFSLTMNFFCEIIAWLLYLMVLINFIVLILRYMFATGSIALQESVLYAHVMICLFGGLYALQSNEHVRIGLFYEQYSKATKKWLNLSGHLLFLQPSMWAIIVTSIPYCLQSIHTLEGSAESGGLPGIFLLKACLPVACLLISIESFIKISKLIYQDDCYD